MPIKLAELVRRTEELAKRLLRDEPKNIYALETLDMIERMRLVGFQSPFVHRD